MATDDQPGGQGGTTGRRPNVGLILAGVISVCVVLAIFWQAAFGGSGGGSAGGEDPSASSPGGGASGDGGATQEESTASSSAPGDYSYLCGDVPPNAAKRNLSTDETGEVQEAVKRFVLTAYGDPGSDARAYEGRLKPLIAEPCFWSSNAGDAAQTQKEQARNGIPGTYAQDLVLFEIGKAVDAQHESGAKYEEIDGTAVWVSKNANGRLVSYQEDFQTAKPAGETGWRVVSGGYLNQYPDKKYKHLIANKIDELQYGDAGSGGSSSTQSSAAGSGSGASSTTTQGAGDAAGGGTDASAGGGSSSEAGLKQAVKDYYRAVDRRDWDYTYENLDSETQKMFTKHEWEQKNQSLADRDQQELRSVEVASDKISGSKDNAVADVTVNRTFKDGSSQSRDTYFVYEGGSWRHRFAQEEIDLFQST